MLKLDINKLCALAFLFNIIIEVFHHKNYLHFSVRQTLVLVEKTSELVNFVFSVQKEKVCLSIAKRGTICTRYVHSPIPNIELRRRQELIYSAIKEGLQFSFLLLLCTMCTSCKYRALLFTQLVSNAVLGVCIVSPLASHITKWLSSLSIHTTTGHLIQRDSKMLLPHK